MLFQYDSEYSEVSNRDARIFSWPGNTNTDHIPLRAFFIQSKRMHVDVFTLFTVDRGGADEEVHEGTSGDPDADPGRERERRENEATTKKANGPRVRVDAEIVPDPVPVPTDQAPAKGFRSRLSS